MCSPAWAGDRLAQFFGSQAALEEFEKTETVGRKIQLLWALPVTQVVPADSLETVDTEDTVDAFALGFVYHRGRYSFSEAVDTAGVLVGVGVAIFETNYNKNLNFNGQTKFL